MRKTILRLLKVIGFALFIAALLQIILNWSSLPAQVPTHYNALGEADSWGNKWFIFFVPLFGLAMWFFLGVFKNPAYINMPGLNENATPQQINNALLMLQVLRHEMLILMSLMSLKDVYIAQGGTLSFGYWEMVIFLGVIFGTIIFFVIRQFRLT